MRKLLICLLLASSAARAGTDLKAAWLAAKAIDPVYQSDLAGAAAGAQKQMQAEALWLPNVSVQAGTGYADMKNQINGAAFSAPGLGSMNNASFTTDVNNGYEAHWGIIASQPIYNAERSANAAQLSQQARMAQLQLQAGKQNLFLRVAQCYFDVLIAQDALHALQVQKKAVQESLDIATAKFEIGKGTSTDMHEAGASFDAVVAQEFALQNDLSLKQALFTDLTGLSAAGLRGLASSVPMDTIRPRGSLQDLIEQGMTLSPLMQLSLSGQQISILEIEKFRAAQSVTVDLVAQYSQQKLDGTGDSSGINNHSGWIGVQVSLPLFTGGMRSSKYNEAIANKEKAGFDTARTRQLVAQQIRTAYLNLASGLQQIKALERGIISAGSKLDATLTGLEAGARTTADVLSAQQILAGVQTSLTQTRYQVLLSALSLAAASGNLSEVQLDEINAFLLVPARQ